MESLPSSDSLYQEDSPKAAESFRDSIRQLVRSCESSASCAFTISSLCDEFGFQRRRLYDVINVLAAVGACKKASVDTISWLGLRNVPHAIAKQMKLMGLEPGQMDSFGKILANDKCISIGRLASSFFLCFFALGKQRLEIKQVGLFLSMENNRYKTTLCKLYQISHILEASSIIERTASPGEVKILDKYFSDESEDIPYSIESLLSRPIRVARRMFPVPCISQAAPSIPVLNQMLA